jgi:hypothetical protein
MENVKIQIKKGNNWILIVIAYITFFAKDLFEMFSDSYNYWKLLYYLGLALLIVIGYIVIKVGITKSVNEQVKKSLDENSNFIKDTFNTNYKLNKTYTNSIIIKLMLKKGNNYTYDDYAKELNSDEFLENSIKTTQNQVK